MARSRSRALDYTVYLVARAAEGVMQILPLFLTLPLVRFLTWVSFWVDRRHRLVALDNLRRAFPGQYTEKQLQRLVRDVYHHFGRTTLEGVLLRRKAQDPRWWAELEAKVQPLLGPLLRSGRPILFVTAHYGNWELGGFQVRAAGIRSHVVARPLDNPYLGARVQQFRESFGHKVLSKQGDLRKMLEILGAGGTLCTLADQDAGANGLFVDFFGHPASTHRVMAVLAQRTNALIAVIGNRNTGAILQYEPLLQDVIDANDYAGDPDAARAITQRMTTAIEDMVRADPRQYLWLHRALEASAEGAGREGGVALPEPPALRACPLSQTRDHTACAT